MAATCQKVVVGGGRCGVIAVGRCSTCGQAMCTSHRDVNTLGGTFVDRCSACALSNVQRSADEQARRSRQYEEGQAHLAAVVRALVAAGSPGIEQRFRTLVDFRRKFLGGTKRTEERIEEPPGWPLGRQYFRYRAQDGDSYNAHTFNSRETSGHQEVWVLQDGSMAVHPDSLQRFGTGYRLPDPQGAAAILERIAREHGVPIPPS